jgi:hypothetical protein
MAVEFTSQLRVPQNVLVRKLEDESVLLNLDTERYFGLDDVGTRMFDAVCESDSVEDAHRTLMDEYDVDPETLRRDLEALVERLLKSGLLQIHG